MRGLCIPGLQHETKCKEFKMSQQKIKWLSKKYCHPEFISASIEHRHAELVSASLVKGDPESSSG